MNARRRIGATPPLAVRVYRWLIHLAPGDLGGRYADDAALVFENLYVDERLRRGRLAGAAILLRSAVLLVPAIWREWHEERLTNARKGNAMSGFREDVRFSIRALSKRPGFALMTAVILATGIGATTTIFSVVDTVVLRSFPYPNAGRLVHFDNGNHSFPDFRSWRSLSAFESVAAVEGRAVDMTGDGDPARLPGAAVSPEFFPMLGAGPALGRLFVSDDFRTGSNVVLLSHGAWQSRWGGDSGILGRTLRIDGTPREVVGVVDEAFDPPDVEIGGRIEVWMPLDDGGERANDHGYHVLGVMARLAPGISLATAQSEIDARRAADAEIAPRQYRRRDGSLVTIPLVPLREATVRRIRSTLLTLLGAVGMLLLIACANVANLFLARGTSRAREVALRSALGASRWRIGRQVLVEATLLALLGGALGVLVAYGGVRAFARFTPQDVPRLDQLAVDPRVLAFTVLLSMATGILFGCLPAIQAARSDAGIALKEGATSVTAGRRGRRVRSGLVVTEIALAVVLMTGAGLLFRSFVRMIRVDPGFETEGLVVMPLRLESGFDGDQRVQFQRDLLAGLREIPGVTNAMAAPTIPFSNTGNSRCCWSDDVVGDPALFDEQNPARIMLQPISEDYFATLRARLLRGREISLMEGRSGHAVAVLNATAARTLFGDADPIGREIRIGKERQNATVIGIENDVHHWGLNQLPGNLVYLPYEQFGADFGRLTIAVRTTSPAAALAPAMRAMVWRLRPELPIGTVETMDQRVSGSVAQPRFLAMLLGAFATLSLILACAGIYSSMLYTVGQRSREMGVRLALGAAGGDIVGMILRSGLVIAGLGIAIGLGAALALSKLIESALWNVPNTDALTYAATGLLLGGTALLACLGPAVRAARADPLRTLRSD